MGTLSTHDPQTLLFSVLLIVCQSWKDICVAEVTDLQTSISFDEKSQLNLE